MNLMALFAFLTLSGQEVPPPPNAKTKASAPARPAKKIITQNPEQAAGPEAIAALLAAALQYCDGADLESEQQLQCLRDTWSGSEDENLDCAPMLVASQAKSALSAAQEACGLIDPARLSPADAASISAALDSLSSSAEGLEIRARELATVGEKSGTANAAYESGAEAAEAANQLQELLDRTTKKLKNSGN